MIFAPDPLRKAREAADGDLAAALAAIESLGVGVITLSADGEPRLFSAMAARLFEAASGGGAPEALEELSRWLRDGSEGSLAIVADGVEIVLNRVRGERGDAVIVRRRERTTAESLAQLGLTPRRAEVLAALMEGETNQQIAQRLELSPRTVQNHIAHIFATLGARTRTEAAARAREALDG